MRGRHPVRLRSRRVAPSSKVSQPRCSNSTLVVPSPFAANRTSTSVASLASLKCASGRPGARVAATPGHCPSRPRSRRGRVRRPGRRAVVRRPAWCPYGLLRYVTAATTSKFAASRSRTRGLARPPRRRRSAGARSPLGPGAGRVRGRQAEPGGRLAPYPLDVGAHRLGPLGAQPVQAPCPGRLVLHQPGLLEQPQMAGHGGLADLQPAGQLDHRALAAVEFLDDGTPVGGAASPAVAHGGRRGHAETATSMTSTLTWVTGEPGGGPPPWASAAAAAAARDSKSTTERP